MKLLTRFKGKPFRNLSQFIGSQTVDEIVEIEDSRDVSEQIDQIKRGMKRRKNEQFILILVRQ